MRLTFDRIPGVAVTLWTAPLVSVSAITVTSIDANDDPTETTITAGDYNVDTRREPGRVILDPSKSWTDDVTDTLRSWNVWDATFVAGYGTSTTDVPQAIRDALLFHTANLYSKRLDCDLSDEALKDSFMSFPAAAKLALDPFKILAL